MRFQPAHADKVLLAPCALTAWSLVRWLLVLLLMFDQVGAPWHAHHHDSGVDGVVVATATHAEADESVKHVDAPDDQPLWAHATTVLRIEAGPALSAADDSAFAPAPAWPAARLTPEARVFIRQAVVSQHEPRTPADLRLPHSPQAPPWRA